MVITALQSQGSRVRCLRRFLFQQGTFVLLSSLIMLQL